MAILTGFHVEGWDHLIFHSFLARILAIPEVEIEADWIDLPGRGWQAILETLPVALHRFYSQCAQLAIIGIDNDGNVDIQATGQPEDPLRPRHWNHAPGYAAN